MKPVPEQYRLTEKQSKALGSDASYGNNGFFMIPHYKINNYFFNVQVSDGEGWEHVSVSLSERIWINNRQGGFKMVNRCPTWEEMCYMKDLFFYKTEAVVQYHPKQTDYVNMYPFALHLWRPTDRGMPVPEPIMVGINTEPPVK